MSARTSAMADWTTARMPDLAGKTVVIAGANSGIGLEAARGFAVHSANVVFAVRAESKGQVAAATIAGSTEVRRLDLADRSCLGATIRGWLERRHPRAHQQRRSARATFRSVLNNSVWAAHSIFYLTRARLFNVYWSI
ncbi:MAG: dehydrogenase [Marmoricola sp.]|nr:dehydrogenase [Marmoricola sp.]